MKILSVKKIALIVFITLILTIASVLIILKFKNIDNNSSKCIITDITEPKSNEKYGRLYYSPIEEEHIAVSEDGINYIDNEILIVANEGTTRDQVEKISDKYNAEIVGEIEVTGDYQLRFDNVKDEEKLNSLLKEIKSESIIESAYLNYVAEISESAKAEKHGDFYYGKKWQDDLQDVTDVKGKSWGIEAINTFGAWDFLKKYSDKVKPVRIGLIDCGFDISHEDLGFKEVFYDHGANEVTSDDKDHGTHVAGTMAARADNEKGICGVYPYGNQNLYGVSNSGVSKYSENGTYHTSIMGQKIAYSELIVKNVKVINQSMGFNWYLNKFGTYKNEKLVNVDYNGLANYWNENSFKYEMKTAGIFGDFLNRMISNGYDFVIVTAAGNDSDISIGHLDCTYASWNNMIKYEDYPEIYNRIIVVGSLDSDYNISNFSNGGERVDVYAPGEKIYSTVPKSKYQNQYEEDGDTYNWSGTSMAAPHVSGVAAMVWSADNSLSGADVKNIVCGKGKYEYIKNTRCSSCKMVDARMAVAAALKVDTKETSQAVENGGVLCYVVDKENEDIKIENATVTLTNNGKEYTAKTDSDGHFEIMIPAGKYSLKVTAKGYFDYKDSVNVSNEKINYLDNWIKMTKTEETLYYEYIKDEFIPKYGLAYLKPFKIQPIGLDYMDYIYGAVSVDIDDYNNDNKKEMAVLSLENIESEKYFCGIRLSLYEIKDMKVVLCDSILLDGGYSGEQGVHYDDFLTLRKFNGNLLFTKNAAFFSGELLISTVKIMKIYGNKIKCNTIQYHSNYDEKRLYYNNELIFDSTEDFVEKSKDFIQERLKENNIPFNSIEYNNKADNYNAKEFNIRFSEKSVIAEYKSAMEGPDSAHMTSSITPCENTNLRDNLVALIDKDYDTVDVTAKGFCGSDGNIVGWKLYSDGLLKIFGEGRMEGYTDDVFGYGDASKQPWHSYSDKVEKIIIEDGIQSLSWASIAYFPNLTEVEIAESVESLGRYSFAGCKNLERITLPKSIKGIERYSFSGCEKLKNITILNNKISIDNWTEISNKDCEIVFNGTIEEWKNAFLDPLYSGFSECRVKCTDGIAKPEEIRATEPSKSNNTDYNDYIGIVKLDSGYLNIRESPNTNGKVIGKLQNGESVKVEDITEDKEWYKVKIDNTYGYVSADYIVLYYDAF